MQLFEQQDAFDDYRRRNAENKARLAQVFADVTSTGQGTYVFDEVIDFGLTFIERPNISAGWYIDLDDWAEELGIREDDEEPLPLPSCSLFVVRWDQDDRDFYVGAYLAVSVHFPVGMVPFEAMPVIEHHVTFSAIAIKDVPPGLDD